MKDEYLLDRTSPSFRNAVDEIVKFIDTYMNATETPTLNILYELGYRLDKKREIEASYITLSVRFSLADNSHPIELALSFRTSMDCETGTIKFNHPLPNPNPQNITERSELWGEHEGEKAFKSFMGETYSILYKLWSKIEEIKKVNAMQILGKEGFLDTSKEPNYGMNSQYEQGLDNLADRSIYDKLIKEKSITEEPKKLTTLLDECIDKMENSHKLNQEQRDFIKESCLKFGNRFLWGAYIGDNGQLFFRQDEE